MKHSLSKENNLLHVTPNTSAPLQLEGGDQRSNGFLEDYSFTIEALTSLYQSTFDENYLLKANELMKHCLDHFQDTSSGMFYFTSDQDKALIARKMELSDNVIPASNSSIAKSLFLLGHYFENDQYIAHSRKMLNHVIPELISYGAGYSNWGQLMLWFINPFYEVAIVGKSVDEISKNLQKHHLSNVIFAGSAVQSSLPLLKNRFVENETFIYVCTNKTCLAPVKKVEEALKQIGRSVDKTN